MAPRQQEEGEKAKQQPQQLLSAEEASKVSEYRILALYRFVPLVVTPANKDDGSSWDEQSLMKHPERHPQLKHLQSELYTTLRRYGTRGTLLLAPEGINGTICYPYPPPTITTTTQEKENGSNDDNDAAAAAGNKFEHHDNQDDDPVSSFLKNHPLFGGAGLRTRSSVWKENQQAFHRLKIKIKPEIVTLGLGRPLEQQLHITPTESSSPSTPPPTTAGAEQERHAQNQLANPNITKGQYLNSTQWDAAMKDPNVLVIDTRNSYEIDIGTFESAVDPQTRSFAEFPDYLERLAGEYDWDQQQQQESSSNDSNNSNSNNNDEEGGVNKKKKKAPPPKAIAMFCTGGIRCEKATSYAIQSKLFPSNLPIYHLEGGILSYLDDVAKRTQLNGDDGGRDNNNEGLGGGLGKEEQDCSSSSSTFHGECFVFDKRVALTAGLEPSTKYISCHGCRGPMDRRLVEGIVDDDAASNNGKIMHVVRIRDDDDNDCSNNIEKHKKREQYEQLLMGIRNLPPLTYDTTSSKWYVPGLTCPRCHDGTTRASFERFAQRKEQMEICAREGKLHFQDNGGQKL